MLADLSAALKPKYSQILSQSMLQEDCRAKLFRTILLPGLYLAVAGQSQQLPTRMICRCCYPCLREGTLSPYALGCPKMVPKGGHQQGF